MRELKFRAWYKDNYIELSDLRGNRSIYFSPYDLGFITQSIDRKDVVLEQYTGLKDKNGKEIYEGDILGGIWEDGYIAYCDKCKQFQYHCNGVGCMACSGDVQWYELVDDKELEVIGNIHENPELLEEE